MRWNADRQLGAGERPDVDVAQLDWAALGRMIRSHVDELLDAMAVDGPPVTPVSMRGRDAAAAGSRRKEAPHLK